MISAYDAKHIAATAIFMAISAVLIYVSHTPKEYAILGVACVCGSCVIATAYSTDMAKLVGAALAVIGFVLLAEEAAFCYVLGECFATEPLSLAFIYCSAMTLWNSSLLAIGDSPAKLVEICGGGYDG